MKILKKRKYGILESEETVPLCLDLGVIMGFYYMISWEVLDSLVTLAVSFTIQHGENSRNVIFCYRSFNH